LRVGTQAETLVNRGTRGLTPIDILVAL
jgi:hypothetical protein